MVKCLSRVVSGKSSACMYLLIVAVCGALGSTALVLDLTWSGWDR